MPLDKTIGEAGLALGAALMLAAAAPPHVGTPNGALFDKHDLAGWHVDLIATNGAETPAERVFRVEKGVIHAYSGLPQGSAQPHAVLVSDRSYANYHLRVEYRWGQARFAPIKFPKRDAGLLLQIGPDSAGLVSTWYHWPKCLEFQIMEGGTGDAYALKARASGTVDPATGAFQPVDRGGKPITVHLIDHDLTSYKLARAPGAVERPGWNTLDAVITGNSARFYLNGHLVNALTDLVEDRDGPPVAMAAGAIALQAEGSEVFYRNITIRPAP